MSRLREYIRDQDLEVYEDYEVAVTENVLSFRHPLNSAKNLTKSPGPAAIALVNQAAERIKNIDDYIAERQARAETLVKQAIAKLKTAHVKVQSADRLRTECTIRIQDADRLLERASSRIAAIEAELSAVTQRAKAAEIRADEAENALNHIEEALRIRIIEKIPARSSPSEVAG